MKTRHILSLLLLSFFCSASPAMAQKNAAIPFNYLPDNTEDQYNQSIQSKTLPLDADGFVILSKSKPAEYAIERYNASLKKSWSATIPLTGTETIEAFLQNGEAAILVTHRENEKGTQQLLAHRVDLRSGQKAAPALLLEAPSKDRKAGIATSPDGTKLLAYRYSTDGNQVLKSISGSLYDGKLQKLADTKYNLSDHRGIVSAEVIVNNAGDQFISLISENMNRLTVRQHTLKSPEAKVMSVLVGGVFGGKKVYIMDSKYALQPNGNLYGAVLTANEQTGEYYSLKAVKFDFENEDMVFAEEFRFTPEYLARVNSLDKSGAAKAKRLEDIYLSDLILTPDEKLVVLAEKKYMEGGENSPYYAKEIHLFAYDQYMGTAWSSVLMKNQKAPSDEAFAGISYRYNLAGNMLHLLTLEEIDGKYDLYLRRIDTGTGKAEAPKAAGLKVADDQDIAYVKDFTAWLTEKDLVTVVRPSKKASSLQLRRLQIK
ncbi:hypothetical protein H9Q13_15390 [Pontibacter sp. JH31]|uniref:S9 family peptidase n=1 Tax=Pontibacter aquaedesilientis TaxID=2766980 RepID=A0ABR7XJU9_9BACT|nr:hypothetical protein [Pontibacter aquaedesilientis]MBD1398555.1 hypothetical protein [Pontibacter aquaedesilientis]